MAAQAQGLPVARPSVSAYKLRAAPMVNPVLEFDKRGGDGNLLTYLTCLASLPGGRSWGLCHVVVHGTAGQGLLGCVSFKVSL